ncbi:uncharacterized protein LOC135494421 [Lineus longissimus]|uniref:uncharacterized protein LOC135494421 n=1 Tax=Lineus longissimus TaxID=88925 RepID=UPI00315D8FD9
MHQQSSPYPHQQWVAQPQPGYQQTQQPYGYPQVPVQQQPAPVAQPPQGQVVGANRPGFDHDSQRRCGILQILIGCILVVVAIVMILIRAAPYKLGFGLWTAPFFLIAGGLGVHSAKTKNTCPIVGCMVMSIFAIIASIVVFSCGAGGLGQDNMFNDECHKDPSDWRYDPWSMCLYFDRPDSQAQLNARIAMNAINIFVGVAGFFVALIQSVFCCKGTCCGGRKQQQQVVVYQQTPQVVVPHGQVPYLPQQPIAYPPQQQPYGVGPQGQQQPYGQGMQGQQYGMQPAPPAVNPEFAVQQAQPSAPPSYDEVARVPPKQ